MTRRMKLTATAPTCFPAAVQASAESVHNKAVASAASSPTCGQTCERSFGGGGLGMIVHVARLGVQRENGGMPMSVRIRYRVDEAPPTVLQSARRVATDEQPTVRRRSAPELGVGLLRRHRFGRLARVAEHAVSPGALGRIERGVGPGDQRLLRVAFLGPTPRRR